MKRILKQINSLESALRYFDFEGKEIARGNLTGDVSGLTGDVSWLLRGDVSGLRGDVDDADLSPEDRQQGVAIQNIVGE